MARPYRYRSIVTLDNLRVGPVDIHPASLPSAVGEYGGA